MVRRGPAHSSDRTTSCPWESSGAPGQGSPSSGSFEDVPIIEAITSESPPADEDDEACPPIEVHVDVGAKDTAVSDQHVSSFYQIWPTPKTEGDLRDGERIV